MNIFLKCEEANHNCDKAQYKEISFLENLKLKLHLIICAACRKYSSKNNKLSALIYKSKIISLPKDYKERLKVRLQQEHQGDL